ncbi:MAG: transporter, family, tetracycline resistance protein [Alphaproteobacteria bacterium]|nr:transporter, family, tetracycline resistance protein [Alphaproteobacteria bacterium]
MTESHPVAPLRRAAFIFVFITVLLDMLALGMIIPVLPRLVVDFVGGDAARGADYLGLFGTAWALMQFVFSPIHGVLSDRFGRRPIILLSNFGLGLDYVLMALAPSLWWLFVGRIISGICAASVSTSYAYIADVTEPHLRAARFGMMGVAFGAGFVLGPALGGLAGAFDPRLPFWIAAALSLLNCVYGFLILPESLPSERRTPFAWRRANPLGSLRLLRSQPQLTGLALVNFLANLAHASLPSIGVLYMMYRYGFDERIVGFTMAGIGVCAMVVQGGLIGPTVRRFGEPAALIMGLLFGIAGFTTWALAPNGLVYWLGIPLLSLWGFAGAASLGLMSRRVSPSEQGQLQGANASMMGIANLIGPGLFTQVFAFFIGAGAAWHLPGAPFLLAALLLAAAAVVAMRVTR